MYQPKHGRVSPLQLYVYVPNDGAFQQHKELHANPSNLHSVSKAWNRDIQKYGSIMDGLKLVLRLMLSSFRSLLAVEGSTNAWLAVCNAIVNTSNQCRTSGHPLYRYDYVLYELSLVVHIFVKFLVRRTKCNSTPHIAIFHEVQCDNQGSLPILFIPCFTYLLWVLKYYVSWQKLRISQSQHTHIKTHIINQAGSGYGMMAVEQRMELGPITWRCSWRKGELLEEARRIGLLLGRENS